MNDASFQTPRADTESCPNNDQQDTSSNVLEAIKLSVSYSGRTVLAGVDVQIPARQITAIVGPSGCGKSSFLMALNRLSDLLPGCRVDGQVLLRGANIFDGRTDLPQLRRRVGMVFQKPNPFPLSIHRNLQLPLNELGIRGSEADDRIERTLRDVGLWAEVQDRLNHSALTLSGGQQQRLCLARALVLSPEVLLCDEPCSALDPLATEVIEDLLTSLKERLPVVIVTHHLAQARRIADRLHVFWMRHGAGTVIESGLVRDVFDSPRDPDTAAYLAGRRG